MVSPAMRLISGSGLLNAVVNIFHHSWAELYRKRHARCLDSRTRSQTTRILINLYGRGISRHGGFRQLASVLHPDERRTHWRPLVLLPSQGKPETFVIISLISVPFFILNNVSKSNTHRATPLQNIRANGLFDRRPQRTQSKSSSVSSGIKIIACEGLSSNAMISGSSSTQSLPNRLQTSSLESPS